MSSSFSSLKMLELKDQMVSCFRQRYLLALQSKRTKHMIEGDCANPTIPLPNVTSVILAKVIEYCKKHVEAPNSKDKVAEEELKFFMLILLKWIRGPCLILFWDDTEEIRKTFNIKNDLTPEEEEGVRTENAWDFE
ncbi:SKP1-like protein 1B [Tanacetum coccineum]